jgi:hypothetical protein
MKAKRRFSLLLSPDLRRTFTSKGCLAARWASALFRHGLPWLVSPNPDRRLPHTTRHVLFNCARRAKASILRLRCGALTLAYNSAGEELFLTVR